MAKLDHLALTVGNLAAARDWYTSVLGLEVEFDGGNVAGLRDDGDFTLILSEGRQVSNCNLYFRVNDVHSAYRRMSDRGVRFLYPPQANDWGYGAGLRDPDDRLVGLWDEKSMSENGSG